MTQINFLPESFQEQRQSRRLSTRLYALAVIAALCIGGWFIAARQGIGELNAYAASLQQVRANTAMRKAQAQELSTREKELLGRVRIQRELTPPVNVTKVIATLAQLMPESLALEDVSILQDLPPIQAPQTKEEGKGKSKSKSKKNKAAATDQPPVRYLNIILHGVAPSGVEVASFVGILEDHPLFERVRSEDTQAEERNGFKVNTFRLTVHVPLDRDYVPTDPSRRDQLAGAPETADTEKTDAP